MKACENCSSNRVHIGENHKKISSFQQIWGVALVYVPILSIPFVFFSAYVTYLHLKLMGAKNIKKYSDFLPDRKSHRYSMKNQITMEPGYKLSPTQTKLYWLFNCTWYCPSSVALFEWHTYLVKLVENWWCPFTHGTKEAYKNASIDKSFWHIFPEEVKKMEQDDIDNPMWNDENDSESVDASSKDK